MVHRPQPTAAGAVITSHLLEQAHGIEGMLRRIEDKQEDRANHPRNTQHTDQDNLRSPLINGQVLHSRWGVDLWGLIFHRLFVSKLQQLIEACLHSSMHFIHELTARFRRKPDERHRNTHQQTHQ